VPAASFGGRGVGGLARREGELLDRSGCRRAVALLALLIIGAKLFLGHGVGCGQVLGLQLDVADLAVFRSAIVRLAAFEPRREHVVARRFDRVDICVGEQKIVDRARLVAVLANGVDEYLGRRVTVRERIDDLRSNRDLAAVVDVILLGQPGIAQHARKCQTVELPVGAVEGRVFADQPRKPVFRKTEIHVGSELVECSTRDELGVDLVLDPEGLGLLARQRRTELAREQGDLPLVSQAKVARRHLDVADGNHRVGRVWHHQCLTAPHHE
jgi:hypothetical protein